MCHRLVLEYKKIPFKTTWFEFSQIESVAISAGAPPTGKKADGTGYYTVPFLTLTPPTGSSEPVLAISGSDKIAEVLEEHYPERPVFPDGSRVFHKLFRQYVNEKVRPFVFPLITVGFADKLNETEWYYKTRELYLGFKFTGPGGFIPQGEEAVAAAWAKFDEAFEGLAVLLNEEFEGNYRLLKDRVCFAEIELVSLLFFIKRTSPDDAWKRLKDKHGGKRQKLLEFYADYLPVR